MKKPCGSQLRRALSPNISLFEVTTPRAFQERKDFEVLCLLEGEFLWDVEFNCESVNYISYSIGYTSILIHL